MRLIYVLVIITCLLSGLTLEAQSDSLQPARTKFAPDHYNLQFAGDIGMFSIGAHWQLFNKYAEVGVGLGYVPKFESEHSMYPASIRVAFTPPVVIDIKDWQLKPLNFGLIMARHYGADLSRYEDTSRYPRGYYYWGVKNRFGIYHDLELYRTIRHPRVKGLSIYLESSAWDIMIMSNFSNGNDDYFDRNDFLILGLGLKLYLE